MAYQKANWEDKIAHRSDLSSQLVHLTRSTVIDGRKVGPVDVLTKILLDRHISGSTTDTGFIVGDIRATCFQDVPVYSIAQNIYAEEHYRKAVPDAKLRYMAVGLMFNKRYVYQHGGRPVIYEETERAKEMLPADEWWRIVRFNLSDDSNLIDWTHEREWRLPGGFDFELEEATVLLPNKFGYDRFIHNCDTYKEKVDFLREIHGIVNLGSIFF